MKILIISPTSSGIGGIAQHVSGLMSFLRKHGHNVDVISSENTFTLPIKGLKNPSFILSSYLKTKLKKKYDVVHAHSIPSAFAMKNITGKKIFTIHGIYSRQVNQLHGKPTGYISSKYEKDALSWADATTVISQEAKIYYEKLGFKVSQIPNAIDIDNLPKREDRRFEKQIIFAGRLSKEKGTDTLLEIAKSLPPDIHLIILGDGPEKSKIKTISESYDNIHYLGSLPKNQTISLIRGSDILIQPSLVEGISSTILESMACQTLVIASNVGGNLELIENNENGILVDPLDPKKIVIKIVELLSDKTLQTHLKENASKTVLRYDWDTVGNQYLNLYHN